ncbi:putative membrane protein YphA (DoxX/SURF4 family) [Streptomyces sp. V4I23]|uniref:DoxX family protein n=1 Tax=Streptomyces sp. V4I23 TaxID=3042282 RepID=UPI0027817675|nr:DoxX family protein [Streptomyces sp. V4I23]MDQ1006043.1 putative membrane protein YphA (DoxX/SURF4 family) [Streptomyces sp. V4I23]
MNTVLTVLSLLLGLLFLVTGGIKVLKVPQSLRIRDHLGVPPALWLVIGALEAVGGAGLLVGIAVPVLGLAASVGLTGLMTGAIASRLRVRDPLSMVLLDVVVLALVAVAVGLHATV